MIAAPEYRPLLSAESMTDEQLRLLLNTRGISGSTYLWATTGDISERAPNRDADRRNRNEARTRAFIAWNKRAA